MSILALTSDTLSSPAAAGQIEYTSPIFAATPIGTQRGIVPTQQYYRLNADYVGTNGTSAQSIFGVGATVSASTVYEFEIYAIFTKTAGTTNHNFQFNFGGTATINNILYGNIAAYGTGSIPVPNTTSIYGLMSNVTTAVSAINGLSVATIAHSHILKGTVSINAGGTFIPQYTCSAAPGGSGYTTAAGSYIRINPLSASGAATNVGTWS